MKRTAALLVILFALTGAVAAQQYWQGTALVASYGRFPSDGAYAASNSFSTNTVVEVTNLESGETTRVVVVDRLNVPGVFMVLSEDAAAAVNADSGSPFDVRVSLPQNGDVAPSMSGAEQPFHPDPDINPAAEGNGAAGVAAAPTEEPSPAEEPAPEMAAEEPTPEMAVESAEEPESAEERASGREPSEARGIGEGITESGGALTGAITADELPDISAAEEPAEEPEEGPAAEPDAAGAAPEPSPSTTRPQPRTDEDGTEAASAPEAAVAEPALTAPQRPAPSEAPQIASAPELVQEEEAPAEPARSGIMSGAERLGRETRHTTRIARPMKGEGVFSFRPAPSDRGSGAGGVASGTDRSGALEGRGSTAGTVARSDESEPQLRVSDLGPRNAPAGTTPSVSAAPGIRTPAAEALGRRPGAGEPIAMASELPAAQDPTEPTDAEPAAEPSGPPEADDLRMSAAPETEAAVPEDELAEAEADRAAEEGLARQPIPEGADVALEPTDHRPPQYAAPETDTGEPAAAEAEAEEEAVATPTENRAESPVAAGSSAGPAAPARTPPVDEPDAGTAEAAEPEETAPEEEPSEEAVAETTSTETTSAETTEEPEVSAGDLPIVRQLEARSFYLQLGVFSRPASADRAMQRLGNRFPYAVFPAEQNDRVLYKVLIGPLTDDEKGAVLYWVRANGYEDAFLRQGDSYEAAAGSSGERASVSSR